ncbi:hypothetical protein BpHYR1_006166, partial [Brachionus plicatilis]
NINFLSIAGLVDTFVKRNILGFSSTKIDLNSNIQSLRLNFYRGHLTGNLLMHNIFKQIRMINIEGRLEKLE